ncbi:MAG: hypothetical protein ACFFCS_29980 [Candidatus Hodarchaeota archaeon]
MISIKELQEERDELVGTILRLEQDLEKGKIDKDEYLKERKQAEARLIVIMDQLGRKALREAF